jgi:hypothetical protein
MGGRGRKGSAPLRDLLSGGDRRSIGRSARARAIVLSDPARVADLAVLANDPDALVSIRAMDLLEKFAHDRPDWIQPHRWLFIGPLADSDKWEIRLQIVRALPLLTWDAAEKKRVLAILQRDVNHSQKFVRAWALDSLAAFALRDRSLMAGVQRRLSEFESSESKALAARARSIRDRIKRS